jgi:hypothetical protein
MTDLDLARSRPRGQPMLPTLPCARSERRFDAPRPTVDSGGGTPDPKSPNSPRRQHFFSKGAASGVSPRRIAGVDTPYLTADY